MFGLFACFCCCCSGSGLKKKRFFCCCWRKKIQEKNMFFSQPGLFFFSVIKPGAEKLRFWTGLFCCFSGLFFFCVSALGRPTFFLIFFKKEFFHFAWFAFFPKYASTTVRVMLSKERFEPAPRAPNKFFELAKEHEVLPYPDPATHHFALLVASFFFFGLAHSDLSICIFVTLSLVLPSLRLAQLSSPRLFGEGWFTT